MHIIPVIDVRHGVAVRAVAGDRATYRPLATPLAASSDPVDVARGLLRVYPFPTLYMADLDGIEGRGPNTNLVAALRQALPETELWVDNGSASGTIMGSESLSRAADPSSRPIEIAAARVLSLDFRGAVFLGPPELLANADVWPDRIIVMTLAAVGMGAGPDLARISEISRRAGNRAIYAAGGIRHRDDLIAARDAGATGALIATALHAGTIKPADIIDAAGL